MHKLAGILGKKWHISGTRKALSQPLIRMHRSVDEYDCGL